MHQQFVKVNFMDASPMVGSLSRRPRKACASISLPTCYNKLHCAGIPICKGGTSRRCTCYPESQCDAHDAARADDHEIHALQAAAHLGKLERHRARAILRPLRRLQHKLLRFHRLSFVLYASAGCEQGSTIWRGLQSTTAPPLRGG